MRSLYTLFILLLFSVSSRAQFTTPNSNLVLTLNELLGDAVTYSGGVYFINQPVIIAPTDKLEIKTDETVKFAKDTYLEVQGSLEINPPNLVTFTAANFDDGYLGVHIKESASTTVKKLTFEYAVSFKISESSPLIEECTFQYNNHLTSTTFGNGAIALGFSSNPVIRNSKFLNNNRAAIQSGANAGSAPQIIGNYFSGNNTRNVNVPHINLGSSGADTIRIINNRILDAGGFRGGGISVLPLGIANIIISGNEIKNNRYGINLQGGTDLYSIVSDNLIEGNNIEGNPNLGGSGIAYSGGNASSHQISIVKRNTFKDNLWGITIQGGATPNIGNLTNSDTSDNGGNRFINNTNTSVPGIDLYNNSPNYIYAQGNYWNTNDIAEVANKIMDKTDNSDLGEVNYASILLPVQLSDFKAQNNGNSIMLFWQTASESNSDYFEVLRSEDGNNFTSIGKVKASGKSSTQINYSFEDVTANSMQGKIFYKLKLVDMDASSSYSKTVSLVLHNNQSNSRTIHLFPNSFTGRLNITAQIESPSATTTEVRILTMDGKLIAKPGRYNLVSGMNNLKIQSDLPLPSGLLLIQFISKDFEVTKQILKH